MIKLICFENVYLGTWYLMTSAYFPGALSLVRVVQIQYMGLEKNHGGLISR